MLSYLRATMSSLLRSDDHGESNPAVNRLTDTAHRSDRSTDTCLVRHGSSTWLERTANIGTNTEAPTLDNVNFPSLPSTSSNLACPSAHETRDIFYDAHGDLASNVNEIAPENKFVPVTTLRRYSPVRDLRGLDHPRRKTMHATRSSCFAAFASYLDDNNDEEEERMEKPIQRSESEVIVPTTNSDVHPAPGATHREKMSLTNQNFPEDLSDAGPFIGPSPREQQSSRVARVPTHLDQANQPHSLNIKSLRLDDRTNAVLPEPHPNVYNRLKPMSKKRSSRATRAAR